MEPAFSESKG